MQDLFLIYLVWDCSYVLVEENMLNQNAKLSRLMILQGMIHKESLPIHKTNYKQEKSSAVKTYFCDGQINHNQ